MNIFSKGNITKQMQSNSQGELLLLYASNMQLKRTMEEQLHSQWEYEQFCSGIGQKYAGLT